MRVCKIATAAALLLLLLPGSLLNAGQVLRGHVPAAAAHAQPLMRLSPSRSLELAIGLPLRNREALTNLLQQIYDPASSRFHQYLTPAQFTDQFGPSERDYTALIAFARSHHLAVTATHPNRALLGVRGSVADIEQTFHLTL